MSGQPARTHSCIVIVDEHGAESASAERSTARHCPVQFRRFGTSATLLQKALHRAARIAEPAQTFVTALDDYREHWESSLWFLPPANRFVAESRTSSLLTTAAALQAIAAKNPERIVVVLPARCFVEREDILRIAIDRAIECLPGVAEGVITFGMMDLEEPIDEDYLVGSRSATGIGFELQARARQPIPWIARHLKVQGAMVASGIMVGYAGVFTAYIAKQCPGITARLDRLIGAARVAGAECEIPFDLQRGVPPPVLRALRWYPPVFAQRALRVFGAGWSGLKSPRAVERISAFLEDAAAVEDAKTCKPVQQAGFA